MFISMLLKNKIFLIFLKSINIWKRQNGIRTCMAKKNSSCGCSPQDGDFECSPGSGCRVEAVLSVDERGQMVVPKDIRERAGIKTGDKLAMISWEKNGIICCLALMKVENLSGMVKEVLDPLMHNVDS
jgi:AbrB family looped-hinge helix DNA binding protein